MSATVPYVSTYSCPTVAGTDEPSSFAKGAAPLQGGRNHVVAEVFDCNVASGKVEIHTGGSDPMTFKEAS